ncbi:hypothetical protein Tco_1428615 [Tanacetum coccineum]
MVDSQPERDGTQRVEGEGTGTGSQEGPSHDKQAKTKETPKKLTYGDSEEECSGSSKTKGFSERSSDGSSGMARTRSKARSFGKSQRSLSRSKTSSQLRRSERLGNRSRSKTKAKEGRAKSRSRRCRHRETSSESDYDKDSKDTCEDLSTPYKRPKPTYFTSRITRFKHHRRAKLPRNIKVHEGSKDLVDRIGIFSAAAEQEEWTMPIWCKMFRQTLSGAMRNWFDGLDLKSMDSFEELSQKFLEEFSQQKSSHIKGVSPVLRISAFMHGHGHPELAKKLNDKIPKTVDDMFERVKAFIRGKVAAGSIEIIRTPQWDKGGVLTG